MNEQKRSIQALENGTVIDHIKADSTFKVVTILKLKDEELMIGANFKSKSMGKKGLIKIANKELSMDELNKISFVAPNATVAIIKDYNIIKKSKLTFLPEFIGIAKCANPNCITNHEPIKTYFLTLSAEPVKVKCKYCERIFGNELAIIQ